MKKGIDVSENNGIVDWYAIKKAGIDFAIIRLGYGNCHLDSMFEENIRAAIAVGLDVGVYYYDYGLNTDMAKIEANFMLDKLQEYGYTPWHLKMGLWYDMEDADNWKFENGMPDNQTITDMCSAFIVECNKRDYSCGIYASLSWLENIIQTEQLADYVPYWVAQWNDRCDWKNPKLWQFTEALYIDGKVFDGNYAL